MLGGGVLAPAEPRCAEPVEAPPAADGVGAVLNGLIYADVAGRVTLFNATAEQLVGVGAFTAMSRPLAGLCGTSELLDAVIADWNEARQGSKTARVVEIHHRGGDLRYIRLQSALVRDRAGRPAGVLVVLEDVTEDHKTAQLRNQFLSIVAHELRTPLTGIKTFATMLSKGRLGPLAGRQQEVVESIREQSIRLEQQIDKLVNLGCLEAEDRTGDLSVLDLVELVRGAVAPLTQPARDKSLQLVLALPTGPVPVRADRSGLRRAVQAFVENAIKFTRPGGHVRVSVELADEQAVVSVQDDGIGIDPRYHRRIFEKFFQVEDPLTRHHGGAGLGLFVASGILAAHGSRTEVVSELGKGAKFAFRLRLHGANADKGTS